MYTDLASQFFNNLLNSLYPVRLGLSENDWDPDELKEELDILLKSNYFATPAVKDVAAKFMKTIPHIKNLLDQDIKAIYHGDPASKSELEITLTYPGFYAIAAYRIAHELEKLNIALIPRIITEYAHGKTGIDIHPGATIGNHFCIDHGTGIVIGETAIIGNHVKIYQGVTIGALSIENRSITSKRHPTIEDEVTIYAQATILGGNTIIGKGSVIGGNTWITISIPPNTKVSYLPEQIKQVSKLNVIKHA
jgi:serine O-acetyltransferase